MKNTIGLLFVLLSTSNVSARPFWSRPNLNDADVRVEGTHQSAMFSLRSEKLSVRSAAGDVRKMSGRFTKIRRFKNILVARSSRGRLKIFADGPEGRWHEGDLFAPVAAQEITDAWFENTLRPGGSSQTKILDFESTENILHALGADGRVYEVARTEPRFTFRAVQGLLVLHRYGQTVWTFVPVGANAATVSLAARSDLTNIGRLGILSDGGFAHTDHFGRVALIDSDGHPCERGLSISKTP